MAARLRESVRKEAFGREKSWTGKISYPGDELLGSIKSLINAKLHLFCVSYCSYVLVIFFFFCCLFVSLFNLLIQLETEIHFLFLVRSDPTPLENLHAFSLISLGLRLNVYVSFSLTLGLILLNQFFTKKYNYCSYF